MSASIAKQVEALTDGEGDPATSGEAGAAGGGEEDSDVSPGDRLPGEDREHAAVSEIDTSGEADATAANQPSLVERDDVSGVRAPDKRPEGEPVEDVAEGGASATASVDFDDGSGAGKGVTVTDDPVAEAEDAPDDDAEEGEASDLGDGSADGAGDDDDPVEVARRAMTKPMRAAYAAASTLFLVLDDDGDDDGWHGEWFAPTGDSPTIALVGTAVPFVRTWPDAPPEALYATVRDAFVDLGLSGAWLDLPAANRMAWECFRDTLISVDRMMAIELTRLLVEDAAGPPIRRVPIEETTLETVDDPSDLTEIGRAMQRREAAAAD